VVLRPGYTRLPHKSNHSPEEPGVSKIKRRIMSRKIIGYRLIRHSVLPDFEILALKSIAEGFEPYNEIKTEVIGQGDTLYFIREMVKYDKESTKVADETPLTATSIDLHVKKCLEELDRKMNIIDKDVVRLLTDALKKAAAEGPTEATPMATGKFYWVKYHGNWEVGLFEVSNSAVEYDGFWLTASSTKKRLSSITVVGFLVERVDP